MSQPELWPVGGPGVADGPPPYRLAPQDDDRDWGDEPGLDDGRERPRGPGKRERDVDRRWKDEEPWRRREDTHRPKGGAKRKERRRGGGDETV